MRHVGEPGEARASPTAQGRFAALFAEIGWTFLVRSHWGGAYNGEMKQLMLTHAFRFVTRVVFVVGPETLRSRRALEKIGATQSGSRLDDNGAPRVVYEITSPAFERWLQNPA